ncbi:hypothetical protein E7Z59_11645 [Robertkochia marina]|uniref:Uncharacterized protein n=1 Tax=Robertkochia marina TaxID=1227945 RepID=A0A4S3M0K5_9FLAO|nr:hypothetical protein [Robertkochia marina]THD66453.1 hypothetical protein E7Z59_11645 [Robertkochia marina]TRZ44130.1 hypothetical protein D3A96_09455 [Robertkochia marina]
MKKGQKKQFLKSIEDKKLKRVNRISRLLILVLGGIVIYNSYQHATPFYYILFFFAGTLVSTIYNYIYSVEVQSNAIRLRSSRWNIAVTLLLLILRFGVAVPILEQIHVTWTYDAIFLFFIGLNVRKRKIIIRQIDNEVYKELLKFKPSENK